MPRPRRVQTPHLVRHVMSRGNGRMQIFLDDRDYCRFVGILGDVSERFEVECWNYCVMPNHYHLTLCPRQPNLSEALRELNSAYAQWWNHRHRRVGHVFQGRFKAQIVDTDSYLLVLCRYIAMNPVRAQLADRPERWRWSSYAATIGHEPPPKFLTVQPVLERFASGNPDTARDCFARFVASAPDEQIDDRIRSNTKILGDAAFRLKVEPEASNGVRPGSDPPSPPSPPSP